MEVYKAINAVQSALAKTGISKDRTNSQGAGYKFRGIDDVYNAIAPLLAEHGLCILPRMLARSCEDRLTKAGGNLFYVTVEAEFDVVSALDGSKHTIRTFGEAMDSGDKATNKAMSAAYKYAAFQMFAIPTEGDNDADSHTHDVAGKQGRPSQQAAPADNSPKATAARLTAGVANGDAPGAAQFMSGMPAERIDAIWALLDAQTQSKLTAAWPKAA
jgi:hypothetical protein